MPGYGQNLFFACYSPHDRNSRFNGQSAAIASAATPDTARHRSPFAEPVLRESNRRRFCEGARIAVVADGAPWIWNITSDLLPDAIQIVDRFHVKQTLHRTAQAIFGSAGDQAKQWATERCKELDEGKLNAIVRALRPHAKACTVATRCRTYIVHNRQRMRYPQFHKQGLCTSSGVLEAGGKLAIGTRLKRSGMHWTPNGTNNIIALRCCRLSGWFEEFWERRNQPLAA